MPTMAPAQTRYLEVWIAVLCPHCKRRNVDVQTIHEARVRMRCVKCKEMFETEVTPMKV